jgi:MYXO-CTERM domain-containing protein
MKKITMILSAMAVCFFLSGDNSAVMAQDASNNTTAQADDDDDDGSDWGLLGLLGLIGLLGLRKKDRDDIHVDRSRTSTTSTPGMR